MRDGWSKSKIKEVAKVVTGTTPSSKDSGNWGQSVPFLTPSDMSDHDYEITTSRLLSVDATKRMSRRVIGTQATAVVCIGATIGKVARMTEPTLTNQQINTVVPIDGKLDSNFSYYLLGTMSEYLLQIAGGSATPLLNKSRFENVELILPPFTEQTRIAQVLCSLDDSISGNKQLIKKLDSLGEVLGEYYLERSNTDVVLKDVSDHLAGKYLAREKYANGGPFAVYGSNNIMGYHKKFNYEGPLTILARIGSNCGNLMLSADSGWVNNNASAIKAKRTEDSYWLHQVLMRFDMNKYRTGSGQPFIQVGDLMNATVPWLDNEVLSQANPLLSALGSASSELHKENLALSATRDELLPLLLSGAIKVKEVAA